MTKRGARGEGAGDLHCVLEEGHTQRAAARDLLAVGRARLRLLVERAEVREHLARRERRRAVRHRREDRQAGLGVFAQHPARVLEDERCVRGAEALEVLDGRVHAVQRAALVGALPLLREQLERAAVLAVRAEELCHLVVHPVAVEQPRARLDVAAVGLLQEREHVLGLRARQRLEQRRVHHRRHAARVCDDALCQAAPHRAEVLDERNLRGGGRVRLVRRDGRDVSTLYGREGGGSATCARSSLCPLSSGGGCGTCGPGACPGSARSGKSASVSRGSSDGDCARSESARSNWCCAKSASA